MEGKGKGKGKNKTKSKEAKFLALVSFNYMEAISVAAFYCSATCYLLSSVFHIIFQHLLPRTTKKTPLFINC